MAFDAGRAYVFRQRYDGRIVVYDAIWRKIFRRLCRKWRVDGDRTPMHGSWQTDVHWVQLLLAPVADMLTSSLVQLQ